MITKEKKFDSEESKKAKPLTFNEAIEKMKLPKGEAPKKGEKKKMPAILKEHMHLERIDLSGFKNLRFSRSGLRELIEGINILPCIRSLSLRGNGITDEYDREILELLSIQKIKCIDLSHNQIHKLGGMIGKKIRDECTHIQWLDLTQNEFYNDGPANNLVIAGLKRQASLIYVGLSVPTNYSDPLVKLIAPKKPPFNLNIRNTTLTQTACDYINRAL